MKSKCVFKNFGALVECSSNSVPKVNTMCEFADILSELGYNRLYLSGSDIYEIKDEPYFGYMRGRYTQSEIKAMDKYCLKKGIELVPSIQILAHQHFLPLYERYREFMDISHIMLVGDEKTYALAEKMFACLGECYTSRSVNIGFDEAELIGLGKYLKLHGYQNRFEIMLNHLNRILSIAEKYGFKCEMWSDMFFKLLGDGDYEKGQSSLPEILENKIPQNVQFNYWNYTSTDYQTTDSMIKKHFALSKNIAFYAGAYKWIGFAPDNGYSISVAKNAVDACVNNDIKNFTITMWADNGGEASIFSVLPSLYHYSCLAYNKTPNNDEFKDITGMSFDDFMMIDKINKPYDKLYTSINNKSFIYLYNDPLLGIFDSLLSEDISSAYEILANKLDKIEGKYKYLFVTHTYLSRVLCKKADLGKRISLAYKNKNMQSLVEIYKEIPSIISLIDKFFEAFAYQWNKENKGFGWEVQCCRIGSVKQRLSYIQTLLKNYIDGKISKIDELEVKKEKFAYVENATEDNYCLMCFNSIFTHDFNF